MKKRACLRDAGFSLIEALITLVVLSIAAAAVLSVFAAGMRGSAEPLLLSQAVQLGQEKMDEIMGDRMNASRGFAYISRSPVDNYPDDSATLDGTTFTRSVEIVCVDAAALTASPGPGCPQEYKRVAVTVSWGAADSITLTTLTANY